MLSKKAGVAFTILTLSLLNVPASSFAQTLLEYTPPPMFGNATSEPAKPEKPQPQQKRKVTIKAITPTLPKITKKPLPRPILKKEAPELTAVNEPEIASVPKARPNTPTDLVESNIGPAMPSSPKVSIHKSSILVEDPSFQTGEDMTRNLDAFGDNYTPPKQTQQKNPVLPHKERDKIITSEYVEPTPQELYKKLDGFDGQKIENKEPEQRPKEEATKTSLIFDSNAMELTKNHIEDLAQKVLQRFVLLNQEFGKAARIQVVAYAQTDEEPRSGISGAKRLSLARALSVQGWLVDNGIASTQIDVKAKGDDTKATQKDRVDLYFVTPQN